jgi:hypothetical protein
VVVKSNSPLIFSPAMTFHALFNCSGAHMPANNRTPIGLAHG